jgi:hypothetical protein
MNNGGRPTGSKSAEVDARKRKVDEDRDPALKKMRADAQMQAKMDFFKVPAPPVIGAKSPASSSVLGDAGGSSPLFCSPGGSDLTHAMGWTFGDEATSAMEIVYPDAPASLKDRVADAIYTVKGQIVKWDGKRDFLCVCNGSNGCKGGLKNKRCGAFSLASSSTGP